LPTSFRALRIFHERAAERATHTLREREAEGGETGRAKQNAGEAKDKTQRRRGQSKQESQKTNRGRKRTTDGAMATITKECKGKFVKWAGKVGGGVAQGVCAFPALRFAFHYLLSAVSAARPPSPLFLERHIHLSRISRRALLFALDCTRLFILLNFYVPTHSHVQWAFPGPKDIQLGGCKQCF